VVDSLNKRKLYGKAGINLKGVTDFTNVAGGSPFSKLKDSVTGEFLFYIQNNFGVSKLNKVIKGVQVSGDTSAFTNFIGQKLKGFYSLNGKESFQIPSFQSMVNNDFIEASYKAARQDVDGAPTPWLQQVQVSDMLQLMDIPFSIEFSNLADQHIPLRGNNLMKFTFDKDGFQDGMKKKLNKYYDIEKYLLSDVDALSMVKQHFDAELTAGLNSVKSDLIADPGAYVQGKFSMDELMKLDNDQIKEKIMPAAQIQSVRDQIQASEQLLIDRGGAMETVQKDSVLQKIKDHSDYLGSLEKIFSRITGVKDKMERSGINANQITKWQQAVNAKTISNLNSPENIKEAAANLLPMKGLQRFFTNVSALNIGTFGMDQSERTMSSLLSGGARLTMLKNSKAFGGGFGSLREGGFMKDAGLRNSLFSPSQFMQFLQAGKEKNGIKSSQLSVLNSNSVTPERFRYEGMSMARNILVGTFSKSIRVRKSGMVEAEVSKSATQFRNTVGADQVMEQKSALYSFTEDLWQTVSLGVRYTDDWDKIGLSHNVYMAYSGFGYTNPGNPSSSRGAMQYDVSLRKQVARNKGFVQAQFATRNYNYSAEGDKRWQNIQVNLQGRYRLNRAFTLGGRLNQYQLVRKQPSGKERMYVSRKVMADGQFSGRVAGVNQRTNLSLGWQQFNNIQVQHGANSDLLLVQWVTTVPAGNASIMMNMFYNKEVGNSKLIGDMFNGEAGASFPLFKTVTLTSSLTYLDNKLAARQIGTRQSVNTILLKNFNIGLYVDVRKDIIEPANPYLYGNFRGELSIFYQIK
jgi:hypothetical protein